MHLFQGEVVHQPTQRVTQFTIRELEKEDKSSFKELQQEVFNDLEDKRVLEVLSDQELKYIFDGGGLVIGAFVGESLVASKVLLYPGDDPGNLGRDLDLPFKEQMKVAHQEVSLVKKDYRGNSLQKTLSKVIMQQMKHSSQSFTHLCSTVAPMSLPSLKDKFSQDMIIVDLKEKDEDNVKFLFYKHLTHEINIDSTTYVYIAIDKLNRHKDFLNAGYVGVGLNQTAEGVWIVFGMLNE